MVKNDPNDIMSIKNRLAKLEQRLHSGVGRVDAKAISDDKLWLLEILKKRSGEDSRTDISQYSKDEIMDAIADYIREGIAKPEGLDCQDWSTDQCLKYFEKRVFSY